MFGRVYVAGVILPINSPTFNYSLLKDSKNEFDQEFIDLAKSVYKENDKRATLKKEINLKYSSFLVEEKT